MKEKNMHQIKMEANRERILKSSFALFSERPIESVTMPEIAGRSSVGRATLYRYYPGKTELAVAVGAWKLADFYREYSMNFPEERLANLNAAERFGLYLDAFIDLYRNHKDILRFNQFFNTFIQKKADSDRKISAFLMPIDEIAERFHTNVYVLAQQDHSLRTDVSEAAMFASMVHLMMAAATRYALGLVYRPEDSLDPESELLLLKQMILREYTAS